MRPPEAAPTATSSRTMRHFGGRRTSRNPGRVGPGNSDGEHEPPMIANPRNRNVSRRGVLRLGAGGLLAAGAASQPRPAEAAPEAGDFTFIVVNDLHYQDERCGRWLEGAVRQM